MDYSVQNTVCKFMMRAESHNILWLIGLLLLVEVSIIGRTFCKLVLTVVQNQCFKQNTFLQVNMMIYGPRVRVSQILEKWTPNRAHQFFQ